jgi:hypothetical protein
LAIVGRMEALARLREGQERMDALLAHLRGEELTRPATIGSGDWSAKDLIGHIATWEELALAAIRDFGSHRTPWPERKGGVFSAPATGKISAFNARTVGQKRGLSLREVKAAARRTHHELLSSINTGAFRHNLDHLPDLEAYVLPRGIRVRQPSPSVEPGD